jgi:putative GTP pyrophosphokinase
MAFTKPPKYSKSKINKAGKTFRTEEDFFSLDFESSVKIAEKWRACHAYPINTFQSTLRKKLRGYQEEPIVAQRLKRMPTIIDKMKRHPNMQLTTMQDIGGLRAILGSVKDVYSLAKNYKKNERLLHELYNEEDHIQNPRDEDGYRSLHLMYKYNNPQAQEYNGLRIELQIRTKLQHIWATAVETMGTFLGQALKSRQGDQEWLDFFATVSSAFACMEKTPVLPRHKNMTEQEIFKAVVNAEQELEALNKMKGYNVAARLITRKGKKEIWFYHLIILNSLEKTVQIKPYKRDQLDIAIHDYARIEAEVIKGKKIEPVLVSAGGFKALKRAYPNFFLDISEFCKAVSQIKIKVKK